MLVNVKMETEGLGRASI